MPEFITRLLRSTCHKLKNYKPSLCHILVILSCTNAHVAHGTRHSDHFEEIQAKITANILHYLQIVQYHILLILAKLLFNEQTSNN